MVDGVICNGLPMAVMAVLPRCFPADDGSQAVLDQRAMRPSG
jgi:hypothetical protein